MSDASTNSTWSEGDDVSLCGAWLRAALTGGARATRGPSLWRAVAASLPFPRAACQARWERELLPQLCSFAACVDVAREAAPLNREQLVQLHANALFVQLTGGAVFRARHCWSLWSQADPLEFLDAGSAVYLVQDAPSQWTFARDKDEALCSAWTRAVRGKTSEETAAAEVTRWFWWPLGLRTNVLAPIPWQLCFFRWRTIKRAMRALATIQKTQAGITDAHHAAIVERYAHCWAILESHPEFQLSDTEFQRSDTVSVDPTSPEPVKRGRGRPRKYPRVETAVAPGIVPVVADTIGMPPVPSVNGSRVFPARDTDVAAAENNVEKRQLIEDEHGAVSASVINAHRAHSAEPASASDSTANVAQVVTEEVPINTSRTDQPVGAQDLPIAEEERRAQQTQNDILLLKQRAIDAANTNNELLEMQLGVQVFSQTLPQDPQGHEYFTILRETLLRRARKRARNEGTEEASSKKDQSDAPEAPTHGLDSNSTDAGAECTQVQSPLE